MSCGQVKKLNASIFFLDTEKLFGNRTSKLFDVLTRGTSENFLYFFTPDVRFESKKKIRCFKNRFKCL